jgi:hypothetical protein
MTQTEQFQNTLSMQAAITIIQQARLKIQTGTPLTTSEKNINLGETMGFQHVPDENETIPKKLLYLIVAKKQYFNFQSTKKNKNDTPNHLLQTPFEQAHNALKTYLDNQFKDSSESFTRNWGKQSKDNITKGEIALCFAIDHEMVKATNVNTPENVIERMQCLQTIVRETRGSSDFFRKNKPDLTFFKMLALVASWLLQEFPHQKERIEQNKIHAGITLSKQLTDFATLLDKYLFPLVHNTEANITFIQTAWRTKKGKEKALPAIGNHRQNTLENTLTSITTDQDQRLSKNEKLLNLVNALFPANQDQPNTTQPDWENLNIILDDEKDTNLLNLFQQIFEGRNKIIAFVQHYKNAEFLENKLGQRVSQKMAVYLKQWVSIIKNHAVSYFSLLQHLAIAMERRCYNHSSTAKTKKLSSWMKHYYDKDKITPAKIQQECQRIIDRCNTISSFLDKQQTIDTEDENQKILTAIKAILDGFPEAAIKHHLNPPTMLKLNPTNKNQLPNNQLSSLQQPPLEESSWYVVDEDEDDSRPLIEEINSNKNLTAQTSEDLERNLKKAQKESQERQEKEEIRQQQLKATLHNLWLTSHEKLDIEQDQLDNIQQDNQIPLLQTIIVYRLIITKLIHNIAPYTKDYKNNPTGKDHWYAHHGKKGKQRATAFEGYWRTTFLDFVLKKYDKRVSNILKNPVQNTTSMLTDNTTPKTRPKKTQSSAPQTIQNRLAKEANKLLQFMHYRLTYEILRTGNKYLFSYNTFLLAYNKALPYNIQAENQSTSRYTCFFSETNRRLKLKDTKKETQKAISKTYKNLKQQRPLAAKKKTVTEAWKARKVIQRHTY